jgi:hypothetical protein
MAKRSTAAKIWLSIAMGVVVFAGLIWLSHWRAKKTLRTYKARLVAQGARFGIDEIAPPPAPYDEDFSVLMTEASRLRAHAFDPAYSLALRFVAPGQVEVPWLGTNLAGSYGRDSVTWAQVTRVMESARDDLKAIHAALKNPAASSALNYRNAGPSGASVIGIRAAGQWLAFEAIERLHRNDLAGAQESLRAVTGLVQLHRKDLTMTTQMIRVAIAGLAFDQTCLALQVPGWTETQLEELQAQWQKLEWFTSASSTLEMERACSLEVFERARNHGLQQVLGGPAPSPTGPLDFKTIFEERFRGALWRMAFVDKDELFYLETTERLLEALRSGSLHQSWRRLSVEVAESDKRIRARFEAPAAFRFSMSGMVLGNWSRAFEHMMRQETLRSLMLSALALQRYQLRHGNFPPELGSLVPAFLAAVPVDYMNGQPIHYRVEPDGSFRLYSVGLDGKDDGGNPEPILAWRTYSSLFDGRDAVWPRLASSEPAAGQLEILPLVQFEEAPVRDVIRVLANLADVRLQIDPWARVKIASRPPVTICLENITALDALETILNRNRLVLVKAGTNLVGITTR